MSRDLWMPPLPAPPWKAKRVPSMREYLRPDEVAAMLQAARKTGRHGVRDAAIILMLFRHGLRTAELVALRWLWCAKIRIFPFFRRIHRCAMRQQVRPHAEQYRWTRAP
jgi:integrase